MFKEATIFRGILAQGLSRRLHPHEYFQITGVDRLVTRRVYLLINDLCSKDEDIKFQQFPVERTLVMRNIDYAVGDLLLIYGTSEVQITSFYFGFPNIIIMRFFFP